jgi:hypothetical protein
MSFALLKAPSKPEVIPFRDTGDDKASTMSGLFSCLGLQFGQRNGLAMNRESNKLLQAAVEGTFSILDVIGNLQITFPFSSFPFFNGSFFCKPSFAYCQCLLV